MTWRLEDRGQGEGQARLVETDGHRAVVESTLPFAAGATLVGTDPATSTEYRIKVRGGKRIDDTWFRIEGRFVSLTKAEREELLAAFAAKKTAG
ncbi:MAG TPA: hypothetical protein VMG12_24300 [Polyangiaceae bacterium]|nr:hypothetical protein [Polyangiaceae bacterium]